MKIRQFIYLLLVASVAALVLGACSNDSEASNQNKDSDDGKLHAVSSFSILSDIVSEIGGDHVEVYNVVPIGNDPHEHESTPNDTKATADADIFFYNGLNLEGGDAGWVTKLINSTGLDEDKVFEASENVEPKYLGEIDENEGEVNPHGFVDPNVGIEMSKTIRDGFISVDPDNEEVYQKNADEYIQKLEDIDKDYQEKINDIPKEDRVLFASERAFQYMTDRYGLKEGFIWEVDTEDNGTPAQIKNAVKFIEENKPPVLFVESNVEKRPIETVSNETGVEIYDEIYSDELGEKGSDGDIYITYLESNIKTIYEGLSQSQ